jgi:hypothetical protein
MTTKKELKETYKDRKFPIGVFQIRNTVNNKIFVDSSTDLSAVWNRHCFQLNGGLHPNKALQKDWETFGKEHFVFEILGEIKQDETKTGDQYREEAKQLAALFIEELKPFGERGYNIDKKS